MICKSCGKHLQEGKLHCVPCLTEASERILIANLEEARVRAIDSYRTGQGVLYAVKGAHLAHREEKTRTFCNLPCVRNRSYHAFRLHDAAMVVRSVKAERKVPCPVCWARIGIGDSIAVA